MLSDAIIYRIGYASVIFPSRICLKSCSVIPSVAWLFFLLQPEKRPLYQILSQLYSSHFKKSKGERIYIYHRITQPHVNGIEHPDFVVIYNMLEIPAD
jgi:hypothetical protein